MSVSVPLPVDFLLETSTPTLDMDFVKVMGVSMTSSLTLVIVRQGYVP